MSVIFKEKQYDRLLIIIKELLIIVLLLIISLIFINLFLNNLNSGYQTKLNQLQQEELKHLSLIKKEEKIKNQTDSAAEKYKLLMTLAACSKNINLNSLHFKNNMIILMAESKNQEMIFRFVDSLKADPIFSEVNLLKMAQQSGYFFQLETIISQ